MKSTASPETRPARPTMRKPYNNQFKRSLTQITEELVASAPSDRNWRGIVIALLVIGQVCGLVGLSVYLLTPPDGGPLLTGRLIQNKDLFSPEFKLTPTNATWISDDELMFVDWQQSVVLWRAGQQGSRQLISNLTYRQLRPDQILLSANKKYALLRIPGTAGVQQPAVGSCEAHGVLEQLPSQQPLASELQNHHEMKETSHEDDLTPHWRFALFNVSIKWHTDFEGGRHIQWLKWSPRGEEMAGIINRDLFYWKSPESEGKQITKTGQIGHIYNGVTDWLYRERVTCRCDSFWFSPAGTKIVFLTINDTQVWRVSKSRLSLFPGIRLPRDVPFPTSEGEIPSVTIHWVEVDPAAVGPPLELPYRELLQNKEGYVTSVEWVDEETIVINWLNRDQDQAIFILCNTGQSSCNTIHSLHWPGILESRQRLLVSKDLTKLIYVGNIGGEDSRREMISKDIRSPGGPERVLTSGHHEVEQIISWNQDISTIFYIGSGGEDASGERHLYSVSLGQVGVEPTCYTCNSTFRYSDIILSHNSSYYIQVGLGPGIPQEIMFSMTNNTQIMVLSSNNETEKALAKMALPRYKRLSLAGDGGRRLEVRLTLPPTCKEDTEIQFPLLMILPENLWALNTKQVWTFGFDEYMASQNSYIVARLDVAGSRGQGKKMEQSVKGESGEPEIKDIQRIVRILRRNFTYISDSEMCVVGVGYGGWLATGVLGSPVATKYLDCAIIVNPLASWHNTDAWTSERYLGKIRDNFPSYDATNLANHVAGIAKRSGSILVVDGSSFSSSRSPIQLLHTMDLSKLLVQHDMVFRQMIYPDEELEGEHWSHFVHLVDTFLEKRFTRIHQILPPEIIGKKFKNRKRKQH